MSSGPKDEGVPTNNHMGRGSGPLLPLRRFRQGPSYTCIPSRLVSQSATLNELSIQGCKRAKHMTYNPINDHWVILTTSKAFHYSLQRDRTPAVVKCVVHVLLCSNTFTENVCCIFFLFFVSFFIIRRAYFHIH